MILPLSVNRRQVMETDAFVADAYLVLDLLIKRVEEEY